MKEIIAVEGQTVFDVALQEMGAIEGAFAILDMNAFLRIDQAIPAGQVVFVPDEIIHAAVVDYYARNNIHPASGTGEENTLKIENMINITQKLGYDFEEGSISFDGVRLANMGDELSIQINYEFLAGIVRSFPEQSLDGVNYSPIERNDVTLYKELEQGKTTLTINITDLVTNYMRIRLEVDGASGRLSQIIWRQ